MATTSINIRVDAKLKEQAEALFNDLGMNMSTAIVMFLKSAVGHNGLPFEVKRLPVDNNFPSVREKDSHLPKKCVMTVSFCKTDSSIMTAPIAN